MTRLRYHQFSLFAGKRKIIDRLDLELHGPGVTALLGPSGVGKSSLLRATQRLLEHRSDIWSFEGDILFDDKTIYGPGVTTQTLARRIGFIAQKPRMLRGSAMDNVAFALRHNTRLPEQEVVRRAEEALERVGLARELKGSHCPASGLSGGQAQRLAIARAIALDPEVLLMDEPCSALDPVKSHQVEQVIADLARDKLVLVVTHDVRFARRLAGYAVFLFPGEDGARATAAGPVPAIMETAKDESVLEMVRLGGGHQDEPVAKILKQAAFASKEQTLLFVCGGNTSRSPIAEAICCGEVKRLRAYGRSFRILSAGLDIKEGAGMSDLAREALGSLGYPAKEHRTRLLDAGMVASADRIFCMSAAQCRTVLHRFPQSRGKLQTLDPIADIANPHGGDREVYHRVASRIRDAVRWHLDLEKEAAG